ncbi:MAG: flavin reductase family protein [bacterium]|nr:flavin reductase family protein [bacterium]
MKREAISFSDLSVRSHQLWNDQWLLITAGDFASGKFNTMTVAWGSLGTMWNKPFAQIVVRPQRHTYKFTEEFDTFTLTAFGEDQRDALKLLGTKSGRDGDKIAEAGLTPIPSLTVPAPGFAEARLIIECRKMYWDDIKPQQYLYPGIDKIYPAQDYHRIYFGEIVSVQGTPEFSAIQPQGALADVDKKES